MDDRKLWMICPRQPSSESYLPGTVFEVSASPKPLLSHMGASRGRYAPGNSLLRTVLSTASVLGSAANCTAFPADWTAWEEWCAFESMLPKVCA
jgi:hypothetical protein